MSLLEGSGLKLGRSALVLAGWLPLGCGVIGDRLPTPASSVSPTPRPSPSPSSSSGSGTPIPIPIIPRTGGTPAPGPTPTPGPSPTPRPGASPTPSPSPTPRPVSTTCGSGTLPPLAKVDVRLQNTTANGRVLSATAMVGPSSEHCASVGYTDGRRFCPPKAPSDPGLSSCEAFLLGPASDTGRSGPTWTIDEVACVPANGCENHPESQFLVYADRTGTYSACAQNGICGSLSVGGGS
jgi:hypothetical protein